MNQALFLVIAILGLLAAVGTVLTRNLVHAALYLVAFFFVTACQFVMLEAEFLAAIQVLVYIGAVSILLMFGIMLTRNVQGDITTTVPRGWVIPGLIAAFGLFFILAFGINNHVGIKSRSAWAESTRRPLLKEGTINDMGRGVGVEMTTRYMVAFEVAGLLLTAALVGAVALAHREDDEPSADRPAASTASAGGSNGDGTVAATTRSSPAPAPTSATHA